MGAYLLKLEKQQNYSEESDGIEEKATEVERKTHAADPTKEESAGRSCEDGPYFTRV